MSGRNAVVVGGGIGGLAAAIALRQAGWQVQVLERAPAFTEVGAGISLWPNALRALAALGLGAQVRALGEVEASGGIRDAAGRWLAQTDTAELERRYGPLVMLHRADLLRTLLSALPESSLVSGAEVSSVVPDGARTVVKHALGESAADLVVAADGIHSQIRRSLWPAARGPRYAGYTAWRFITSAAPAAMAAAGESWGRGDRFGFAPLADGRVYCFATANLPAGSSSPDGELAELRRRFDGWHDPIPAFLAAATPDSVLRNDVYDLPALPSFVTGQVALLGDAAHAMTPNMGQGGCQALEDAVALAATLTDADSVDVGLATYDHRRRRHTQALVRRSRQIGTIAGWEWRPAITIRNLALRLTPSSVMIRSLSQALE